MTLTELRKLAETLRLLEKRAVNVTPSTTLGAIERGGQLVGGAVGGVGRALMEGSGAAGSSIAKSLGGGAGARMLGGAVKYSPYAIGGYAVNRALDDPVGKFVQQKVEEYRLKRMQDAAAFDPSTGMWT